VAIDSSDSRHDSGLMINFCSVRFGTRSSIWSASRDKRKGNCTEELRGWSPSFRYDEEITGGARGKATGLENGLRVIADWPRGPLGPDAIVFGRAVLQVFRRAAALVPALTVWNGARVGLMMGFSGRR
jgi:hypothetical protein